MEANGMRAESGMDMGPGVEAHNEAADGYHYVSPKVDVTAPAPASATDADELLTMGRIQRMLEKLPRGPRARVVTWVTSRFGA